MRIPIGVSVVIGAVAGFFLASPVQAIDFTPYGFIKGSFAASNNSIASYARDSWQAPTEVQNLDRATDIQSEDFKKSTKNDFQIAQSRFGMKVVTDEKLSGVLEFDFIDLNNNPIGTNVPRLRLAEIYYDPNDWLRIRAGQGWSTFGSPWYLPNTFNFVGAGFRAGNSAFLSQLVEGRVKVNNFNYYAGLSLKGRNITGVPNAGIEDNPLTQNETNVGLPAVTLKAEYATTPHTVGAAVVFARLDYDKGPLANADDSAADSLGGKLFYRGRAEGFDFRAEAYYGANLNDIFFLTLASNKIRAPELDFRQINEYGFYLSGSYEVIEGGKLHLGVGQAEVEESYQKLAEGSLVGNRYVRGGYSHLLEKSLTCFFEATWLNSTYLTNSMASSDSSFSAVMGEVGLVYNF